MTPERAASALRVIVGGTPFDDLLELAEAICEVYGAQIDVDALGNALDRCIHAFLEGLS
jgi:hypothetical protein